MMCKYAMNWFQDGRDITSNSASDSSISVTQDISSPDISVSFNPNTSPSSDRSHVASDNTNMQVKGYGSDAIRVSVSSAPSTSSQVLHQMIVML